MKEVDAVNISAYELRIRLNSFANRFSGVVETSADEITEKCSDPQIQQNALLWKMSAIPPSRKPSFNAIPWQRAKEKIWYPAWRIFLP